MTRRPKRGPTRADGLQMKETRRCALWKGSIFQEYWKADVPISVGEAYREYKRVIALGEATHGRDGSNHQYAQAIAVDILTHIKSNLGTDPLKGVGR